MVYVIGARAHHQKLSQNAKQSRKNTMRSELAQPPACPWTTTKAIFSASEEQCINLYTSMQHQTTSMFRYICTYMQVYIFFCLLHTYLQHFFFIATVRQQKMKCLQHRNMIRPDFAKKQLALPFTQCCMHNSVCYFIFCSKKRRECTYKQIFKMLHW